MSAADVERLRFEAQRMAIEPVPGTLAVFSVDVEPTRVRLRVPTLPADVVRLDTLVRALRDRGSPLGAIAARYVIERVASITKSLHAATDVFGRPRTHGALHGGAVLIAERGAMALVGTGLRLLDSLLLVRPRDDGGAWRGEAPETAANEPIDARADVYALGVLYYELLSGKPYTGDLPAELPDPKAELVALLDAMLQRERTARLGSVERVLDHLSRDGTDPGQALHAPELLHALIREYVSPEMPRGPSVLLGAPDPSDRNRVIGGSPRERDRKLEIIPAATKSAPEIPIEAPLPDVRPVSTEPERNDWAKVLGADPDELKPPAARPLTPVPPPPTAPLQPPPSLAAITSNPAPARPAAIGGSRTQPKRRFTAAVVFLLMMGIVGVGIVIKIRSSKLATPPPEPKVMMADPVKPQKAAPPIPPAPQKDAPAKPISLVTVISTPSGADVELDGGYVGKTPLVLRTRLDKPSYKLSIELEGYEPFTRVIQIDPQRQTINIVATLLAK